MAKKKETESLEQAPDPRRKYLQVFAKGRGAVLIENAQEFIAVLESSKLKLERRVIQDAGGTFGEYIIVPSFRIVVSK